MCCLTIRRGSSDALGDLVPRVDVSETENALEVTAELPGLELKECPNRVQRRCAHDKG